MLRNYKHLAFIVIEKPLTVFEQYKIKNLIEYLQHYISKLVNSKVIAKLDKCFMKQEV